MDPPDIEDHHGQRLLPHMELVNRSGNVELLRLVLCSITKIEIGDRCVLALTVSKLSGLAEVPL